MTSGMSRDIKAGLICFIFMNNVAKCSSFSYYRATGYIFFSPCKQIVNRFLCFNCSCKKVAKKGNHSQYKQNIHIKKGTGREREM